jgi:hypothetical protein
VRGALARHQAALASQSERREALVVAEVERNLRLVGVTGVEDKLQEGVADTIRTLLAARIRVWTITGDKQETAITVGVASGLLRSPETVLLLNAGTLSDTAQRIQELQVRKRRVTVRIAFAPSLLADAVGAARCGVRAGADACRGEGGSPAERACCCWRGRRAGGQWRARAGARCGRRHAHVRCAAPGSTGTCMRTVLCGRRSAD